MITISGDDPILRLAGSDQASADSFLPNVKVHESSDLPSLVKFGPLLFQPTDEHHLVIQTKITLLVHYNVLIGCIIL
jgi:hypothetical protein